MSFRPTLKFAVSTAIFHQSKSLLDALLIQVGHYNGRKTRNAICDGHGSFDEN